MGDEEPSMLQVDPRLEAEMNATDGQWTGEDFDPREWFGDESDRHHGGRHHRMMQRVHIVLTHLLTFFLGVAFMLLRSRFCPSCGRCCCCKKKPTRVADVVPATVVVVSSAPASDKSQTLRCLRLAHKRVNEHT